MKLASFAIALVSLVDAEEMAEIPPTPSIAWKASFGPNPSNVPDIHYQAAGIAYVKQTGKVVLFGHGGSWPYITLVLMDAETGREGSGWDSAEQITPRYSKGFAGDVLATSNGSVYAVGYNRSYGNQLLIKLDGDLNIKWVVEYPDEEKALVDFTERGLNVPDKHGIASSADESRLYLTGFKGWSGYNPDTPRAGIVRVVDIQTAETIFTYTRDWVAFNSVCVVQQALYVSAYYMEGGGGDVTKFDTSSASNDDLQQVWDYSKTEDVYQVAATTDRVFVTHGEGLDCIAASDATLLWDIPNENGEQVRSVIVSEDQQYVITGGRNPLRVRLIDIQDGTVLASVDLNEKSPFQDAILDLSEGDEGSFFVAGYSKTFIETGNVAIGSQMFAARVDFFTRETNPPTIATNGNAFANTPTTPETSDEGVFLDTASPSSSQNTENGPSTALAIVVGTLLGAALIAGLVAVWMFVSHYRRKNLVASQKPRTDSISEHAKPNPQSEIGCTVDVA